LASTDRTPPSRCREAQPYLLRVRDRDRDRARVRLGLGSGLGLRSGLGPG